MPMEPLSNSHTAAGRGTAPICALDPRYCIWIGLPAVLKKPAHFRLSLKLMAVRLPGAPTALNVSVPTTVSVGREIPAKLTKPIETSQAAELSTTSNEVSLTGGASEESKENAPK